MAFNPYSLEGKTVLVTGASSGIGKATAIACSRLGAHVIVSGRNSERLQETFSELDGEGHLQIIADLTDEESINRAYFKLKDEIVRGNIVTDDEGEINHYAFQYNPDEDYARSITYIYQRLCGYLKSTQRFYIAFHLEDHPEEEYPVDLPDESMMSVGEPKSYLTFDDVRRLTGLSKKELKKKLKEKQIVAMYDEDAVRQAFDEEVC